MSKRYESQHSPSECPACGSKRIAYIVYGLQVFTPELEAKMKAGQITLGGCCVSDDDPKWECADCEAVIFRKREGT